MKIIRIFLCQSRRFPMFQRPSDNGPANIAITYMRLTEHALIELAASLGEE